MNYVKSCLIITMLLGVGYSQCNESNWEDYYPNMAGCYLAYANLSGANLIGTNLTGADFTSAYCHLTFFVAATLENTIFDDAGLLYAYFDENEDEYDDVSYDAGAESGDLNLDGVDNVLDVVLLVNNILLTP